MCHCKNQVKDFGVVLNNGCITLKNENIAIITATCKIKITDIRLVNQNEVALWKYSLWMASNRGVPNYLTKICSFLLDDNSVHNQEANYTLRKGESIILCLSHPETTPEDFQPYSPAVYPEPPASIEVPLKEEQRQGIYHGRLLTEYPVVDFIVSGVEL